MRLFRAICPAADAAAQPDGVRAVCRDFLSPASDRTRSRLDRALGWCLAGWAFAIPVSIAAAQVFLYPACALALALWIRTRDRSPLRSPLFLPAVLFLLAAILASALGDRPGFSLWKTRRLAVLLPVLFGLGTMGRLRGGRSTAVSLGVCFLAGASLRALYDAVRIPVGAARGEWIFGLGTMRDPQFYLTALLMFAAAWPGRMAPGTRRLLLAAAAVCAAAFLLHFKRGSWFVFAATYPLLCLIRRRFRPLLVLALLAGLALALPQTRARLQSLRTELSAGKGGRWALWTRIAPVLIPAHPMGMGIAAPTNEDFRRVYPRVEPKLNHLHNNPLQILLETGWIGLAAWLAWMAAVFRLMTRNLARAADDPALGTAALALLAAFLGLQLNGLVEYNFGDSEILMLFILLMGLSDALRENGIAPARP